MEQWSTVKGAPFPCAWSWREIKAFVKINELNAYDPSQKRKKKIYKNKTVRNLLKEKGRKGCMMMIKTHSAWIGGHQTTPKSKKWTACSTPSRTQICRTQKIYRHSKNKAPEFIGKKNNPKRNTRKMQHKRSSTGRGNPASNCAKRVGFEHANQSRRFRR